MENSQARKFSPCRLIGFAGVLFIIIACIAVGTGALLFINIPSLIVTFGITFFMLLAAFGTDFLRFLPNAFLTLVSKNPKPNPRFAEIALHASRYIIGAGLIGTLIGLIQMLSNLSDPSGIGVGMACALLTIFYAIIASELFFAFLYKAYSDGNKPNQTKPLPLKNIALPTGAISLILIAFFVMLISFADFNG